MVFLRFMGIYTCFILAVNAQEYIPPILSPEIHNLLGQGIYSTEVEEFLDEFGATADNLLDEEFRVSGMDVTFSLDDNDNLETVTLEIVDMDLAWSEFYEVRDLWEIVPDHGITKYSSAFTVYNEIENDYEKTIFAKINKTKADCIRLRFDKNRGNFILAQIMFQKIENLDLDTGSESPSGYTKNSEESKPVETEDFSGTAQKEEISDFDNPLGVGKGYETGKNERITGNKEYIGDRKDGKPHGYGTMNFANSGNNIVKFIGYFEEGTPRSPGQLYYKNGDRYEGKFNCDSNGDGDFEITTREINGKQHYANGDYYEGIWKNDQWHYSGTWIKKNGDRYVGGFENGLPQSWVTTRISGKLSVHAFNQGEIDWTKQSGVDEWYEGNWPHEGTDPLLQQYAMASPMFDKGCMFGDCENGTGISYYGVMNNVYYGPHKNGKPNGVGEMFSWRHDQATFKGPFKEGKLHGMIRKESREEIFLDRIFYEGKIESGFYNSMEEFEAILGKEIEEIERDFASRPPGVVWEYIYSDDNGSETAPSWRRSDYDVCLSGDCENGYASIAFGSGDSYMGKMKNGLYHGEGHLTIFATGYSYYGNFKDGALHGEGSLYDEYRNWTEGRWEYNQIVSGSAYNTDGCKVYDGIYQRGKLASTTFRSSTCNFYRGETAESGPVVDYSGSSGGGWKQETIDFNKGTKDEWSITVPVWKK